MKIEEALSLYDEAKQIEQINRAWYLTQCKNQAIKRLDDFIKFNIHDILKAPRTLQWFLGSEADFPHYDVYKDIQDQYPEFTLNFNRYMQSIDIKLADKDWDWNGYGIKDIEEPKIELKPKTKLLQRIFKRLFS